MNLEWGKLQNIYCDQFILDPLVCMVLMIKRLLEILQMISILLVEVHVEALLQQNHFNLQCNFKKFKIFRSLGTDTGGSVSYPAHCCGIYSMKPSYGRLSRFGQILYSSSNDVIGPMANSTSDLETMFDIMQGNDPNDSNCIDFQ